MALDLQETEQSSQKLPENSRTPTWPREDFGTQALRARSPAPGEPAAEEKPAIVKALRETEIQNLGQGQMDRPGRRRLRRRALALVLGLLISTPIATGGYLYWDYGQHFQSTGDAFIAARAFAVTPKVSGYIAATAVTDNQHVAAGEVIARIDDRDYRTALHQAQAQVNGAQASIQNIDAQISVQKAQIASNQAQVEQVQAALAFAGQQAARFEDLASKGAGSVQNAQQYGSQLRQQQAALASAQAGLTVAQRQIEALKAQREIAVANVAQAKAQRDQAQLNLSYTILKAPEAGRIANLSGAAGQFAQSGTAIATFVPDKIWITANFKETQLDEMRPDQPVTIRIDAYSEREIHGRVDSVQPGSGTAFSLLPAENATGNWVKVVQRVPVKIVMDNAPADIVLGPGMSIEADVRVNPNPSLYERLRSWL